MNLAGRIFFCLGFISSLWMNVSVAQTVSVGSLQDEQIQLNLLLRDSLNFGAINRPSGVGFYDNVINGDQNNPKWWRRSLLASKKEVYPSVTIGVTPFQFQNSINSRLPYGENNGAAWYGRGYTTEATGGFYLRSDYVSINVQPHIIYQ